MFQTMLWTTGERQRAGEPSSRPAGANVLLRTPPNSPSWPASSSSGFPASLPRDWDRTLAELEPEKNRWQPVRRRDYALQALATSVPNLVGGSADLGGSTGTTLKQGGSFGPASAGRVIHWGVREHGMGACLNGIAAHGGLRPFGSTFLVFSDYMKPAIRLAAIMRLPVIYIGTHDSIGLGEDGPTHQPVEHLAMLRAIPNLVTIRPADTGETIEAWKVAMERSTGPTILVLTRQKLPVLTRKLALAPPKEPGGVPTSCAIPTAVSRTR